jgi:S-DNA-T family DNA segregation ATPase FtsK/SpoIIIE
LLVVLVDEVALLTAYTPDRKLRDRAEKALAAIATQGRAPGVVLVAALQDPRKEVLGLRNLFPTTIAMRLDEKSQVDMVLGEGARESGALCHQIPDTSPGVAYVKVDGVREPVRVRAAYYDDQAIGELAHKHAPSRTPGSRPVFSVVDNDSHDDANACGQEGAA